VYYPPASLARRRGAASSCPKFCLRGRTLSAPQSWNNAWHIWVRRQQQMWSFTREMLLLMEDLEAGRSPAPMWASADPPWGEGGNDCFVCSLWAAVEEVFASLHVRRALPQLTMMSVVLVELGLENWLRGGCQWCNHCLPFVNNQHGCRGFTLTLGFAWHRPNAWTSHNPSTLHVQI